MIQKKYFIFVFLSMFSINCFGYYHSLHVQKLKDPTVTSPDIARNATGQYIYVIYIKSSNYYVDVSTNYGNPDSWTTVQLTTDGNASGAPKIAATNVGDHVDAIWTNSSGTLKNSFSDNFGSNWSTPTNTVPNGAEAQISAISSPQNGSYITFTYTANLFFSPITNGQLVQLVTVNNSGGNSNPQIITSNDGHIVYIIVQDSADGIILYASLDSGQIFDGKFTLGFPSAVNPQIATSTDGKYVYFTFKEDADSYIRGFSTSFGGSSTTASITAHSASAPQIATDSSGRFAYNIFKAADGTIQLYYTHDYGSSWTLVSLNQEGENPHIATDLSGRYVIASLEDDTGSPNVPLFYYSQNFGKTWTQFDTPASPVTVTDKVAPILVTSDDGEHTYGVWVANDDSAQLGVIRRSYLPPLPPIPDDLNILPPNVTIVK